MRGLPAPPAGVVRFTLIFDTTGVESTTSVWLLVPGVEALAIAELEELLAQLTFVTTPFTTNCTGAGTLLVRVRLQVYALAPVIVTRLVLASPGRWTGQHTLLDTLVVHWLTTTPAKSRPAQVHLPGPPDVFVFGNGRLTDLGFGTLQSEADTWLNGMNSVTSTGVTSVTVGTLHRQAAGVPLSTATFDPAVGVLPSAFVGALRRRRPIYR